MRTNTKPRTIYTYEGAPAQHINAEQQLRRSLMACLLFEKQFYEDGIDIAERIAQLVPQVDAVKVAAMAVEAREEMHLRHAPLLVVREMARHDSHKPFVEETLYRVIQRADELAEFLAIYWKDGKEPLANSVKRGLARAFRKFDRYQLSKYNRNYAVRLRDVMFMVHPEPKNEEQADVFRRLADNELSAPDTWEVALSAEGELSKRQRWERLLRENRMGAMAVLRNLRNFEQEGVEPALVHDALQNMNVRRVLPFRFIAAARYAPRWEPELEAKLFESVSETTLDDETVVLVDVSGSMGAALSERSDMKRLDAACGVAMVAREICEHVRVFTFSRNLAEVGPRRGFALRDAIVNSQPHGGTYLGGALRGLNEGVKYDRIIVITDEQSHDGVPGPDGIGYVINVASYRNGVGYGAWTHVDGWSESVIRYIAELEAMGEMVLA